MPRLPLSPDGDGREDAVCVVNDWSEYGVPGPKCPLAYDASGSWTNNQILAYIYWRRNVGGVGGETKWGESRSLLFGGHPEMKPGPYGRAGCGSPLSAFGIF